MVELVGALTLPRTVPLPVKVWLEESVSKLPARPETSSTLFVATSMIVLLVGQARPVIASTPPLTVVVPL